MEYYTLLTAKGTEKIVNAIASGSRISLKYCEVGDGGGTTPIPDESATSLVGMKLQIDLQPGNIKTIAEFTNWIVVDAEVPADQGGWYIREVGLFDADCDLIAYGNYPETYKPSPAEGAPMSSLIQIVLQVTNNGVATIVVEGDSYATISDIDAKIHAHMIDPLAHPLVTHSIDGFMAHADKIRLDQVFDNVTVAPFGEPSVALNADSTHTSLTISAASDNVLLDADTTTKTLSISVSKDADTIDGKHASDFVLVADHIGAIGETQHGLATTSIAGFLSPSEKVKLNTISEGAQSNQDAFSEIKVGLKTIKATDPEDNFELIAGDGIELSVIDLDSDGIADTNKVTIKWTSDPASFDVDTVDGKHASDFAPKEHIGSKGIIPSGMYRAGDPVHGLATETSAGFMSIDHVQKLETIEEGAEVNQPAFSNVKVGTVILVADDKMDQLELEAGLGIELTVVEEIDKVIIATTGDSDTVDGRHASYFATKEEFDDHDFKARRSDDRICHPIATETSPGFLSTPLFNKIDAISENQFSKINILDPSRSLDIMINPDQPQDTLSIHSGKYIEFYEMTPDGFKISTTGDADKLGGLLAEEYLTQNEMNHHIAHGGDHHPLATVDDAGFLSPGMYNKLQNIEAGAEKNIPCFGVINITKEGETNTLIAEEIQDSLNLEVGEGLEVTTTTTQDKIRLSVGSHEHTATDIGVAIEEKLKLMLTDNVDVGTSINTSGLVGEKKLDIYSKNNYPPLAGVLEKNEVPVYSSFNMSRFEWQSKAPVIFDEFGFETMFMISSNGIDTPQMYKGFKLSSDKDYIFDELPFLPACIATQYTNPIVNWIIGASDKFLAYQVLRTTGDIEYFFTFHNGVMDKEQWLKTNTFKFTDEVASMIDVDAGEAKNFLAVAYRHSSTSANRRLVCIYFKEEGTVESPLPRIRIREYSLTDGSSTDFGSLTLVPNSDQLLANIITSLYYPSVYNDNNYTWDVRRIAYGGLSCALFSGDSSGDDLVITTPIYGSYTSGGKGGYLVNTALFSFKLPNGYYGSGSPIEITANPSQTTPFNTADDRVTYYHFLKGRDDYDIAHNITNAKALRGLRNMYGHSITFSDYAEKVYTISAVGTGSSATGIFVERYAIGNNYLYKWPSATDSNCVQSKMEVIPDANAWAKGLRRTLFIKGKTALIYGTSSKFGSGPCFTQFKSSAGDFKYNTALIDTNGDEIKETADVLDIYPGGWWRLTNASGAASVANIPSTYKMLDDDVVVSPSDTIKLLMDTRRYCIVANSLSDIDYYVCEGPGKKIYRIANSDLDTSGNIIPGNWWLIESGYTLPSLPEGWIWDSTSSWGFNPAEENFYYVVTRNVSLDTEYKGCARLLLINKDEPTVVKTVGKFGVAEHEQSKASDLYATGTNDRSLVNATSNMLVMMTSNAIYGSISYSLIGTKTNYGIYYAALDATDGGSDDVQTSWCVDGFTGDPTLGYDSLLGPYVTTDSYRNPLPTSTVNGELWDDKIVRILSARNPSTNTRLCTDAEFFEWEGTGAGDRRLPKESIARDLRFLTIKPTDKNSAYIQPFPVTLDGMYSEITESYSLSVPSSATSYVYLKRNDLYPEILVPKLSTSLLPLRSHDRWVVAKLVTDGSGNVVVTNYPMRLYATYEFGNDLAERYSIKDRGNWQAGQVVLVSTDDAYDCEVSNEIGSNRVLGIISTNPCLTMRESFKTGVKVGRVGILPCFVQGPVLKGEPLVSGLNGVAIAASFCQNLGFGCLLGRANATILDNSIQIIEVII